jgi:hypothetical protein
MAHYENVGEPILHTLQVFWFNEQMTRNGHMRRGAILADDGRTSVGQVVEFNGPDRPNGEVKGIFQIVEVTTDNDTYTQYQLLGSGK